MNIQLVYPDINSYHGLGYHPGLASIASVLKKNGHEVRVFYFNSIDKIPGFLDSLKNFKPDLIGFTSVETQFYYANLLAEKIKMSNKCIIVCGGPYVTLFPLAAFQKGCNFDAVIRGEGEYAFLDLAERIGSSQDWRAVSNLAFLDNSSKEVIINKLSPLVNDLDSLPYPSTELFGYQEIIDTRNIVMFNFNRGCPYFCGFCSNASLGQSYGLPSNPIRFRSVGSVMNQIENTVAQYKLKDSTMLHFEDDLFIFNKRWILDFCSSYKKRIGRPFWCTGRSNHVDDEICAALKKAGCSLMMMSVESGNDYIRNEVMRRNIPRDVMFKSFKCCARSGIKTLATCIIGLPFETPVMIKDSIKTVAQLESVTVYGINIFYPYKGTHLRAVCEENNLLDKDIPENFLERKESVLNLPTLSKNEILYYHNNWLKLIMRHKGAKERLIFNLKNCWESIKETAFGKLLRYFFKYNFIGKILKRGLLKMI